MNRRAVGAHFEELAAAYLEAQGFVILERNYRCRQGEIDLVAREKETVVFVEVKYRRGNAYGAPEEAVHAAKQQRIRRVAQWYLLEQQLPAETCCRFDVVAVDGDDSLTHYRNAFGGI